MLRETPSQSEFVSLVNAEMLRLEALVLGWRDDGTNLHIRFRSALASPWVQVHVQSSDPGKGGATYDPVNFVSTTLVDCRANRLQDVTLTDLALGHYTVFFIPVQYDGAGVKILYDGQSGRPDRMTFLDGVDMSPETMDAYPAELGYAGY